MFPKQKDTFNTDTLCMCEMCIYGIFNGFTVTLCPVCCYHGHLTHGYWMRFWNHLLQFNLINITYRNWEWERERVLIYISIYGKQAWLNRDGCRRRCRRRCRRHCRCRAQWSNQATIKLTPLKFMWPDVCICMRYLDSSWLVSVVIVLFLWVNHQNDTYTYFSAGPSPDCSHLSDINQNVCKRARGMTTATDGCTG